MTVGDAGTGGSSSTATTADTAMSGTASSAGSTSTSAASTGEDDSTTTATEATTETGDGESTSADETSGIGGEDNVLYVHVDGQNSNAGTIEAPMRTIQWAISQARRQPQIDTIRVAEGEYAVDYANSDHIVIEDGVSVLGGYSSDWADQDPAQFLTNIVDESEWTPSSESNPHRTVEVPEAVGSDTFVEGLHVGINSGEFRVAILVTGNATIRNNVVEVTMGEVSQHWGVYVTGATPSIIDNRIHFSGNETLATGVDARNSQAVIAGNVVDLSEVVFGATGVRSSVGSNLIAANTIDLGPSGGAVGVRFDSGATPTIDNNLIGSPGQSGTCPSRAPGHLGSGFRPQQSTRVPVRLDRQRGSVDVADNRRAAGGTRDRAGQRQA